MTFKPQQIILAAISVTLTVAAILGYIDAHGAVLAIWGPLGFLAGGETDKTSGTSQLMPGERGELETQAQDYLQSGFADMRNLVGMGPGAADVTAGNDAYRGFADMLRQYSETGGAPSSQDITQSNTFADQMFGRRREELNQSFTDQNTEVERLAARLGRPVNDPILQAKLRTGFMRENALLSADKTAFSAQNARQMSQDRIGFAGQRADVLGNLSRQAFQNRAALMGLGSQIQTGERQWRLNTGVTKTTGESGGGFKGQVAGGMAGTAVDLEAFQTFGSMGMGGGGGGGGGGAGAGAQAFSAGSGGGGGMFSGARQPGRGY